jgi:hypothetical protein
MQIRELNSGHARSLIAFVGSHVSRAAISRLSVASLPRNESSAELTSSG